MRTEVPETQRFWSELERELHRRGATKRRRRFGVPVTAMRVLRTLTRHMAHATAIVLLAVVMVTSWSEPTGETANVQINTAGTPAYLAQFGANTVPTRPNEIVARAKDDGYEVSVQRLFITDPSLDGQILSRRHPGPVTADGARGPLLFVIGYTIGEPGDELAN